MMVVGSIMDEHLDDDAWQALFEEAFDEVDQSQLLIDYADASEQLAMICAMA